MSITLAKLQSAARKRWKNANVRENKSAPDAETKREWMAQNAQARERIKQLKEYLKRGQADTQRDRLLSAARFVCDVNGDHPSIEQLRSIVAEATRIDAAKAEIAELDEAIKKRQIYRHRWNVSVVHSHPFPHAQVVASADSREQLLAIIENSPQEVEPIVVGITT